VINANAQSWFVEIAPFSSTPIKLWTEKGVRDHDESQRE
jgi:hypothetical protein